MAQNQELRVQSSTPTSPGASTVKLYANASGVLKLVNPAGTVYNANTFYTDTSASGLSAAGAGAITGGATLGSVAFWISGNVNGVKVVIPAYTASF